MFYNYVKFVLSSIVITSLGEEGAGRFAGCLLVYPHFVVSRFTTLPPGAGGRLPSLTVALPGDFVIGFFHTSVIVYYCSTSLQRHPL